MRTAPMIHRIAVLASLVALLRGLGGDALAADVRSIDSGCTRVTFDPASGMLRVEAAGRIFAEDLKDWERAINHYLETGQILE